MKCRLAWWWVVFTGIIVVFGSEVPFGDDDENRGASEPNESISLRVYGSSIYGQPSEDVGRSLREWSSTNKTGNAEEQGNYFEGDILFPKMMLRNGLKAESFRWPGGVVPVEIENTFDTDGLNQIKLAMREYHSKTCIQFVKRVDSDADYLYIQNTNTGCWSSIGKVGKRQPLNLQSPGCTKKVGTVLHELMHALGFMHEHNRENRDGFIQVHNENIKPGYETDFNKAPAGQTDDMGIPYDYGSILHYSETAFSRNGQPTLSPKKTTSQQMGQREGFSDRDLQKINKMYKCGSKVTKDSSFLDQLNSIWGIIYNVL